MIKSISRNQILTKVGRFLDSNFGTPAPDKLTFVELGSAEDYGKIHIKGAIYMTTEQVEALAHTWLPDPGAEIVIYSDKAHQDLSRSAAEMLSNQGYGNIYLYANGKEDWISNGLWTSSSLVPADGIVSKLPE